MNLPTLGRFVVPEVVATHFLLQEGMVVADFGAGSGYFIPTLATMVGETGRVIACEIQKPLIEKLGALVRERGFGRVDVVWCDLETPGGIKIRDNALDVGILVNTLFQFEDKVAAVSEIHRTLKPGGTLHVIDWTESYGGLGPQPAAVVSKDTAIDLFESNGYVYEREYPAGDHHYGLAFRVI